MNTETLRNDAAGEGLGLPAGVVEEGKVWRWVWGVVMGVVAVVLLAGLLRAWYPAHPGVDQNGYLVGGKYLALTGSPGFVPPDPYWFVGAMWNLGPDGKTFYPKYPLGLPGIYAVLIWTTGVSWGTWLSHLVSPVATVLAVVGTYVLARPYVRGFGGVLAAVVVAVSPVTVALATNPNSHATTLAAVVWGMAGLMAWWRVGGWWRAVAAGGLLGFALTVRYTEGLLLLPMALVAVDRWWAARRGGGRRVVAEAVAMGVAWAVPVGALVAFNWVNFGTLTGYDTTRESTGFGWVYFVANWDLMLREMGEKAMAMLFGLGLAGMGMMISTGAARKLGVVLASWAVPCLLCYTAYYWAPETGGVGYARFVLTAVPALALGAVWVLTRGAELVAGAGGEGVGGWRGRWVGTVIAGGVVGLGAANLAVMSAETAVVENRGSYVVELAGEEMLRAAPAGSVVFAEPRILHHLQFVGDYAVYSPEAFSRAAVQRMAEVGRTDDPHPLQPQRAAALYERLKDLTEVQLTGEQNRIMDESLAAGKRVFWVGPLNAVRDGRKRFVGEGKYEVKVVAQWQEPGDFRRSRWQRTGNDPPPWANRRMDLRVPETRPLLWQVVEITAKPATTRPATRAATTKPATTRATSAGPATTQRAAVQGGGVRRQRNQGPGGPTSRAVVPSMTGPTMGPATGPTTGPAMGPATRPR